MNEEKERYTLVEEDFAYAIVDNEEHKTYQQDCFDFGNICDLLNQQDKRIKELEALTRELNFDFAQTKERLQALQDYYTNSIEMLEEERKNILSKLNSDESFSLQTYRSLQRRLSEKTLKIEVFAQFINDLYMLEVEI